MSFTYGQNNNPSNMVGSNSKIFSHDFDRKYHSIKNTLPFRKLRNVDINSVIEMTLARNNSGYTTDALL